MEENGTKVKEGSAGSDAYFRDVLDVLSSEYNAVYYCNTDNDQYDILFQKGFVKADLIQMRQLCPTYQAAFMFFCDKLVHPDDRERMKRELSSVPKYLKDHKSIRIEFKRLYGERYLYTEAYCVKVGEADEPLKHFVAGFIENDDLYRANLNQKRQLEDIVTERTSELQNRNKILNRINEEVIELLGNITEARDAESGEHIRRVKGFTNILAKQIMHDWPEYGITDDTVELITSASALHDIGKISIPDAILLKPGKLTKQEFDIMKTHCVKGCEMLRLAPKDWSASYLKYSMDICHYHHERYDGHGYPEGLVGDRIPISAQITAVADCFDALISKRVYKDAYSMEKAFEMIRNGECGAFSDKIISSFEKCKQDFFSHALHTESCVASSMPAGISTASLSWVRILLVDDDALSRHLSQEILEGEGAEVVCASSGEDAVKIFKASEKGYFDAILMDVTNPGMNGIESADQIRHLTREDAATVSLIALTLLPNENELALCLSHGMDSMMAKPVSVAQLNKVLFECLENHSEALDRAVNETNKEAEEQIEKALRKNRYQMGIDTDYALICYISGNNNDVSGFRCDDRIRPVLDRISHRLPPNRRLDQLFRRLIPESDYERFVQEVDRNKLVPYLKEKKVFHAFVPFVIDGTERLYRLRIVPDEENENHYILYMQSVDDETENELFAGKLIQALAECYIIADYIDLQSNRFTRCHRPGHDTDAMRGVFTNELDKYVSNDVYEADRERVHDALSIDRIRECMDRQKSFSMRFRSVHTGSPRYMEIQLLRLKKDENGVRFVLLTLSDVDEAERKEQERNTLIAKTKLLLEETERSANRDPLTGVKNITAYTGMVAELTDHIRMGTLREFAVLMCDINGLCRVNESFGFADGDVYIRNGCQLVCDSFKHSPVYRIGGDEFAVVIKGVDYENREKQMDALNTAVAKARELPDIRSGKADLSTGLSVFDPQRDISVADVIKRAEKLMYINKQEQKRQSEF